MKRTASTRSIIITENDAAALAAGKLSQIRVPLSDFPKGLNAGDVLWTQERFIYYQGRRSKQHMDGIGYGNPVTAKRPEKLKGIDCKVSVCDPKTMRRMDSRFTLVVSAVKQEFLCKINPRDALESGIVQTIVARDGVDALGFKPIIDMESKFSRAHPTPDEAYLALWQMNHPGKAASLSQPVLAITFKAHNIGIIAFEKARAA